MNSDLDRVCKRVCRGRLYLATCKFKSKTIRYFLRALILPILLLSMFICLANMKLNRMKAFLREVLPLEQMGLVAVVVYRLVQMTILISASYGFFKFCGSCFNNFYLYLERLSSSNMAQFLMLVIFVFGYLLAISLLFVGARGTADDSEEASTADLVTKAN